MTRFNSEYEDCALVFAKGFKEISGTIQLTYDKLFVMKCLKELDHERIAKDVCDGTPLKDVQELNSEDIYTPPSDWVAVSFVCKHINNLSRFYLPIMSSDSLQEILKLLRKRCISQLSLTASSESNEIEVEHVFNALLDAECARNHKHTNLALLTLKWFYMGDNVMAKTYQFFENGHANHLQKLDLNFNGIGASGISKFCEVLDSEHFEELARLDLSGNPICDEGANALLSTLMKAPGKPSERCVPTLVKTQQGKHYEINYEVNPLLKESGNGNVRLLCNNALTEEPCKLTHLSLDMCSLTKRCISNLCKVLQDGRSKLNVLSLSHNKIGDEGARVLFEDGITKGHCKLTDLYLDSCGLGGNCIPRMCEALQDEGCKLKVLSLSYNDVGDEGARLLFEDGITKEHCKLTELRLNNSSLTDKCMPSLCKALQDEGCKLKVLSLSYNEVGDEGARVLFEDGITNEHCKLTELHLELCSLTDKCIPRLCKALQNQRCKLNVLSLSDNDICDEGVCVLFEVGITNEHCKITELRLELCALTDKCIPILCEALQGEHCGLTNLWLPDNKFTVDGEKMLSDVEKCDRCKARGLKIVT
jgi:Ran GTPase-activating protein (RanGAP) involved in mRNA processing and transport